MATKGKIKRFTIKKWNGDDVLSWAIFDRGQVVVGLSGLSREEAKHWVRRLNEEHPS